MNSRVYRLGQLMVSLAMAGLAASFAAADDSPDELAAVVEAREIAFARTMADRDVEAFATFISDEAVFFNGNEPLRGKAAVVDAWSRFFESPAAPFSWHPDVVVVLDSGTLALSSGPVYAADGTEGGRFNSIWRREPDGVWRVVFDKGS